MDLLWMPCKWLTRGPGFPSWSWAGWKGPVICYSDTAGVPSSEEVWQDRKSWIDFYIFSKDVGRFQLLSTVYEPQQEVIVEKPKESQYSYRYSYQERLKEIRKTTRGEAGEGDSGNTPDTHDDGGVLASPLWRLSHSQSLATPAERESPYPLHCTPAIDDQTLLFRTMTAYVHISSLNPRDSISSIPRDGNIVLPSAPTLYLYAGDGTQIGSAWSHTQEFFDSVATHDLKIMRDPLVDRLQIEVALLAGLLEGDWRTRNENYTTWIHMTELVKAGMNVGVVSSCYSKKSEYERRIARIYIDMVHQRKGADQDAGDVESRLTVNFWSELEMRIILEGLESESPGHCEETMLPIMDGLTADGSGMRAKEGQSFIKLMLIGHLGDGETNGSGGIKEKVGLAEIRDNTLGLL